MGTNTGTVMTLANSIIGVGVLAMPFCFKQCGIVLSILMLLLSSFLSRLACHFLLKAAIMARRRNFEFLAFHTFGPSGKTIVELCIIGFLMGTCIAFFVVVGDLGPAIVAKTLNISNTASLRQSVLIGLAVFVVIPLGLLRNVDSLSSVCTATIGFYLCLVLKVMAEAMPHLLAGDWVDMVYFWRPAGLLQCIPIFSMALFCQTQLFEIYESLPNATLDKMNDVIRAAVNLCTSFYICVGFFGYVAFCAQNFTGNVLMSFTPTLMSDIIKMGFVLSVAVSFPLAIFPCRASLYSLLFKRNSSYWFSALNPTSSQYPTLEILDNHRFRLKNVLLDITDIPSNQNTEGSCVAKMEVAEQGHEVHMHHHETLSSHIPETRFKCLTIGIISASLIVGLLIPNIELVLGIVGSTIGVLICVMFPAVAFICISSKSTQERLLAQVLVFVGVLILVLGTYATLYAANESGDANRIEAISPLPDHLDSVARMTLIQVDKPVVDDIVVDKLSTDEKLKVKPIDSKAEPKQEPPVGNSDAGGQNPPIQQVDLPRKSEGDKKPDVRQEPPVPVEPPADIIPPVVPSVEVEKKEEKKAKAAEPLAPQHDEQQINEAAHHDSVISKIVALGSPEEKKIVSNSPAEKGKGNGEQVNLDAIKKEDEELAEAEKQAEADNEQKNEELLRKLEKHKEEQKKLLQEQKQILEELKEHKKEIEQAAAKQRNDDNIPQGPPSKNKEDTGAKTEEKNEKNQVVDNNKKQPPDNVRSPQSGIFVIDALENKKNIPNDVQEPQSKLVQKQNEVEKNLLPQHVKLASPQKVPAEAKLNHVKEIKQNIQQGPANLMLQERPNAALLNTSNEEGLKTKLVSGPILQQAEGLGNLDQKPVNKVQKQSASVPVPNKLPLPLPLAVRDNTSRFYKQNEIIAQVNKADTGINSQNVVKQNMEKNVANVDEVKVMRRDILANDKNGFKANASLDGGRVNSEVDTLGKAKLRDILSNNVNDGKLYDDGKVENHERQKRDTLIDESIVGNALPSASITNNRDKNKQDAPNEMREHVSDNCGADEKANKMTEVGTMNLVMLSKGEHVAGEYVRPLEGQASLPESHKHSASPQITGLGSVSDSQNLNSPVEITESASKGAAEHFPISKASITDTNVTGDQKLEGIISSEIKTHKNSDTSKKSVVKDQRDESTLSSIIKTPSHLSEPKLNDAEMKLLNEAVINAKDISVVAKPMTRDLKSISAVQQIHEESEQKEKKDP